MIRASIFALSLLLAAPALAAPEVDGHTHEAPDFVFTEAPTDHVVGNAEADDTMIIYASNVCPACGAWFSAHWPSVKSELVETGQLRMVFRPFVTQPADLSFTGFLMAECAPRETYMTVIEDQFSRQRTILDAAQAGDGEKLRSEYDAIAAVAGLTDVPTIAACLQDDATAKPIMTSVNRAAAGGINSVPSFIFNGTVMTGAHDVDAIKGWIEGRSSARP
jgi:protein-disulfide isomerase